MSTLQVLAFTPPLASGKLVWNEGGMKLRVAIVMAGLVAGSAAGLQGGEAGLIKINGPIGPATASYIERAIDLAASRKDVCLIVQLDTPGGLIESTEHIIRKFDSAMIPVVVWVGPSGAKAGSAGCFITLASDVAAMAPHSTIGAAHPVSLGGGEEQKQDDVMKQKLENFYGAYIENVAKKHGRNAEWAKLSVRKSAAITSEQALETNVIDIIATDIPDLLKQADGREVKGTTLKSEGATVAEIPMALHEKIFQMLWRPEVMLILMLAAIYGVIGEMSNPGAVLPGVVGAIALILFLYMSSILPVNVAGLALIGLAVALFIMDIYAPTHGVLTFGGVVSFFLGVLMLFNRGDPAFRLSLAYIIPATGITAAFFLFIVGAGLRAQFLPVRVGKETMVGKTAPALVRIDSTGGKVFIEGEYWNAMSGVPVEAGEPVEITGVNGLTLTVKPKRT
jgi:membrane-bound serine protease (ClpP class)